MKSDTTSVEDYLAGLPEDRRKALTAVRDVILDNLPDGYEEAMNWGMITYQVPLETFPDTYNKQPLMYAALASEKNKMSLHLMCLYTRPELKMRFEVANKEAGKRLDMGKSCVRFKRLDDLPLDLIANVITSTSVNEFIEISKKAHGK